MATLRQKICDAGVNTLAEFVCEPCVGGTGEPYEVVAFDVDITTEEFTADLDIITLSADLAIDSFDADFIEDEYTADLDMEIYDVSHTN